MLTESEEIHRERLSIIDWILSCLFGIGSWIVLNGVWVELPNLINHLPEGWKLPSYMAMIVQIANIGPISYGILKKHWFSNKEKSFEHKTICFILVFGIVSCGLLTGFWDRTVYIFGAERSIAMLFLAFCISLLDCTSSVTFLPFMSQLPVLYMAPFFIGENMSSLVCALVGLGQGVEIYNGTSPKDRQLIQSPRFSQNVFFAVLGFLTLLSFVSYLFLRYRKREMKVVLKVMTDEGSTKVSYMPITEIFEQKAPQPSNLVPISKLVVFFICMFVLNFLQNGVMSSIGSYVYAPFGEISYHLASTLGPISGSLACLVFNVLRKRHGKYFISFGTLLYTMSFLYLFVMATMSPHPLGYDLDFGKIVIVLVGIISSISVSYTKLAIACEMRHHGHRHLFYIGATMQLGSFCGALIMFPIVNYTKLFKS